MITIVRRGDSDLWGIVQLHGKALMDQRVARNLGVNDQRREYQHEINPPRRRRDGQRLFAFHQSTG
jgi:hypothetical protein